MRLEISVEDLSKPAIIAFLEEHIRDMKAASPPESKHALDLDGLRQPEITFWAVWDDDCLVGCGAIKQLDARHAEIKSMRTAASYRGKGIASTLLEHIFDEARQCGYHRLSLETGSMAYFEPAHALYQKMGFTECSPFANYQEDPNSVFMKKELL